MNIRAAGALLWRKDSSGRVEVAVIHRPRYDDWSLPKGKVEQGESHIMCAHREVLEETGFSCVFGPELGVVVYNVNGTPKVVRYWSARAVGDAICMPDPDEVDVVDWLAVDVARSRLTSRDDQSILDTFVEVGIDTTTMILLRHALPISPYEWDGDDGDRPLNNAGQTQAKFLGRILVPYSVSMIYTSDALRCIQTVEPVAKNMKIKITIAEELSEYRNSPFVALATEYASSLFNTDVSILLCSHAPILPRILRKLAGETNLKELNTGLEPGNGWALHHRGGEIVAVDKIEPTLD